MRTYQGKDSALLTSIAVLYAYFSDSFPDWYLNDVDRAVIEYFQAWPIWLHPTFYIHAPRKVWRYVRKKPTTIESTAIGKKEREEAVTRFILALSDQQLATGLAVVIGALANQCTLTNYDINMAFSLAWFSATTHLATLDCLNDYFQKHTTVWKWRAVGMIGILAFIIYGTAFNLISYTRHLSLPAGCGDEASITTSDGGVTTLYYDPITALSIFVSVFLVWQYCKRILSTYDLISRKPGMGTRLQRIGFILGTIAFQSQHQVTMDELDTLLQYVLAEETSKAARKRLKYTHVRALRMYRQSFISKSPPLIFMMSFGLSQIIYNRWLVEETVVMDSSMGFGQITPLFLLILPLLAGAEIYYEAKHSILKSALSDNGTGTEPPSVLRPSIETDQHSIQRANTVPLSITASSDPDLTALLKDGETYDSLYQKIQKYYYKETKLIQVNWDTAGNVDDLTHLLKEKQRLLKDYQSLELIEKQLPDERFLVLTIYVHLSIIMAFIGIGMNMPVYEVQLVTTALSSYIIMGELAGTLVPAVQGFVTAGRFRSELGDLLKLIRTPSTK
ncbi:hypothetical protein PSPO01_01449 [Paraphaeosphaeria sporulosa]